MGYKITLATPPYDYTTIKGYTELVVLTSPVYFKEDTGKVLKITKFHSQYSGSTPSTASHRWMFVRGEAENIPYPTATLWNSPDHSSPGWVSSIKFTDAEYNSSSGNTVLTITKPSEFVALALTADEIAQFEAIGATVENDGNLTFSMHSLELSAGTHTITVKAKGTGYMPSPASNAVEYGGGSPSGVEIVSWADGTDEQIAAMVAALDDGTLTIEETGWQIGDERTVTLSAMDAIGVTESHVTQDVTLVLMDSQHYNLTEATPGGSTKDHFVVGLKNVLANGTQMEQGGMYKTATENASWGGCDRRVWCNNVFRMAIPNALRGCFKQFKVPSATTYDGSSVTETDDYFAMFAEMEVQGVRTYSNSYESAALSQIEWYKTDTNRIKRSGNSGDAVRWITRSLRTKAGWFCGVKYDGTADVQGTAAVLGLAPFGCI